MLYRAETSTYNEEINKELDHVWLLFKLLSDLELSVDVRLIAGFLAKFSLIVELEWCNPGMI